MYLEIAKCSFICYIFQWKKFYKILTRFTTITFKVKWYKIKRKIILCKIYKFINIFFIPTYKLIDMTNTQSFLSFVYFQKTETSLLANHTSCEAQEGNSKHFKISVSLLNKQYSKIIWIQGVKRWVIKYLSSFDNFSLHSENNSSNFSAIDFFINLFNQN